MGIDEYKARQAINPTFWPEQTCAVIWTNRPTREHTSTSYREARATTLETLLHTPLS
jgi:hypothetical protein